jgi:lipopolysaccharide transport system permease protein
MNWQYFRKNARLIFDLTRREIAARYTGTMMGLLWAFVHPLILLAVYTVVFGMIFRSKWGGSEGSSLDFALVLFVGLIAYNLFSECANRATTLIVSNPNYVKKIVFPLEVLPVVMLGSALFHAAISLVAWCVLSFLVHGTLNWTSLLVVLIYIPMCCATLGLSFILSSLGVYFRDIGQFTSLVTASLLFLSPIFYSVEHAPAALQTVLAWNPLTFVIEQSRAVMIYGEWPQWVDLGLNTAGSVLFLFAGSWWFRKTREGFADVL